MRELLRERNGGKNQIAWRVWEGLLGAAEILPVSAILSLCILSHSKNCKQMYTRAARLPGFWQNVVFFLNETKKLRWACPTILDEIKELWIKGSLHVISSKISLQTNRMEAIFSIGLKSSSSPQWALAQSKSRECKHSNSPRQWSLSDGYNLRANATGTFHRAQWSGHPATVDRT